MHGALCEMISFQGHALTKRLFGLVLVKQRKSKCWIAVEIPRGLRAVCFVVAIEGKGQLPLGSAALFGYCSLASLASAVWVCLQYLSFPVLN